MKKYVEKCNRLIERDHRIISQSSRAPYFPFVIKRGKGAIVEDLDGHTYIDLFSSSAVLNTGHAHPNVVAAIKKQVDQYIHFSTDYMYAQAQVELAEKLLTITPGNFEKRVCFGLSGSDAVDGAIKLARSYSGRSKIISFIGSYHGSTYGALSLSAISLNMKRKIGPLLPEVFHMPYPDSYRSESYETPELLSYAYMKNIETAFSSYIPPEEVAAVIIEPIAGDLGFVEPPQKFMELLYQFCKKHGILFIVDEIQQGFARTGKWFSIEHFNLEPDILIMGKSMASGLPLSAIVARSEIVESLGMPAHLFTLQGNSTCVQAAIATIKVIEDEKLIERARTLGIYIQNRFRNMQKKYEVIGDVRGKGLSIGVELVKNRITKERDAIAASKITYRCWTKGVLLIFLSENILRVQPPLIIKKNDLDIALNIIEEAIKDYENGDISDEALEVVKGW